MCTSNAYIKKIKFEGVKCQKTKMHFDKGFQELL